MISLAELLCAVDQLFLTEFKRQLHKINTQ